jgi:Xaa-Pro dipeptidase
MANMDRLKRLIAEMTKHSVEAVVVTAGTNLRYLTTLAYHSGERLALAIVTREGEAGFVLPAMEAERVRTSSTVPFWLYPWSDAEPAQAALGRCMTELGLAGKRIAIEHLSMRVFELRAIENAARGATFVDAAPLFDALRVVKDSTELAAMRVAARMIDQALAALLARVKPGLTEREVAALWIQEILRTGSEGSAFECIIASGPNGAFPHHTTGGRKLERGDFVILDGGCRHEGYASDITRTVALGKPREELVRMYDVVKQANAAGCAASRPGATGKSIDAAARKVITDAGYGPHFLHRTGHGLGLDVHEEPYIAADQQGPLPPGCVFTIEPGLYAQGLGGVRIEDNVALTPSGHEILTRSPRDLVIL